MGKFLEKYNLLRLNYEEIESLNRQINHKKTESEIKTTQQTEVQDQVASLVNSTRHSKKIKYVFFSNSSQKSNLFYQTQKHQTHYPDTKTRKGTTHTHTRK